MSIEPPKPIKLYSNKSCPWAQRSRIALLEAGVKYEEVEIDLVNKPEWYWKVNQQGKVPALDFGGEILIESNVISEFVVDLFRDAQLLPYGGDATSALQRARARQFVEIYISKINPFYYAAVIKGEPNVGPALVEAIQKYIVPILPDTPFILGDKFGLAEILVSPFVVRLYLLAKLGFLGEGVEAKLEAVGKWNTWANHVLANESLKKTFNLEAEGRKVVDRIRKVREANKIVALSASQQASASPAANGTKV